MFDYVLSRDLYHRDGLARVFSRAALARRINAPFRHDDRTARPDARGVLPVTRVDFPVGSVMLKTNWLPVSAAPSVGIDPERDGPFVTVRLDPAEAPEGTEASEHILLSLHVSSKAVPHWTWATFEHVANQGRCDLIGCNDSFGYRAPAPADFEARLDGAVIEAARNYIAARQVENAFDAGIDTFAFAGRYAPGERTDALAALFEAFGIASGAPSPSAAADAVTAADPAWGMFRLKGTLVDFVSPTGEPSIVGNSITEAGFSDSSSCMTCHAQAAVDGSGRMAFAIFSHRPSYLGFPESVNGAPKPAKFAVEGRGPNAPGVSRQRAVQTDFVWGFRFARPLADGAPAD